LRDEGKVGEEREEQNSTLKKNDKIVLSPWEE